MSNEHKQSDRQPLKLFISHATVDEFLAGALVDLCQSALALPPEAIRCTSVTGYRLPGGTSVDEQLRREVHAAPAFIAIISYQSIQSPYVLLELGARWGANLHLLPVLAPGIETDALAGPLSGIHALKTNQAGLLQLVEDLRNQLSLDPIAPTIYQRQIDRVLAIPAAAPPDTSITNDEGRAPALSPEALEVLVAATKSRNGAVLIFKLAGGTVVRCDNKQFSELGNPRSEAKWKQAVEDLEQAGFIESPEGGGSLWKITATGFQMADELSGRDQLAAEIARLTKDQLAAEIARLTAENARLMEALSPAVLDPSVPPPPLDQPGPDGILHYPAHWYAAPLPGTEDLIDVRYVENAADLDKLKASDPTRAWWDTPAKLPRLELAAIRRVDGRPYGSG